MPKIFRRPDSEYWFAWVTDPSTERKVRVSTGEKNKRLAQHIADAKERRSFDPSYSGEGTTLETAAWSFITQRVALKSEGTQAFYRAKIGTLLRLFGPKAFLVSINAERVDWYCATRLAEGTAKCTVGKELTALRGILKLARRHKLYPHAVEDVMPERWPGQSARKERWCTEEEVWALIHALPPHRGAVVAFHVATGSNLGECMRAQPEDVSADKRAVFLRGTKRATRRRTAPVMPWGEGFLGYALMHGGKVRGRPMFQDWSKAMRWDLKRVTERLGLAPVSSNDLRRTYSTWLRNAGVDPSLIGVTLGHKDSRMAELVYGRVPVDKLRPLIDRQIDPAKVH